MSEDEKLDRLVKLNIVSDEEKDKFKKPRYALEAVRSMKILTWEDYGHHYIINFNERKPLRLRPKQVWEAIADKIFELKDPLNETVEEKTQETEMEKPSQEGKEVRPKYEDLLSEELTEMLKERGLPFTGAKASKIKRLEENDSSIE